MPLTTAKDLTGQTFGKLTVVGRTEPTRPSRRVHWLCVCECGERTVKNGKYLLCGDTGSCGCDQRAYRAKGNVRYGTLRADYKHEYTIWRSMKSRCKTKSSSNYRFYGAKGITFCDEWSDFSVFLRDMGPCPKDHTLDRIDTAGNYEPRNCRWATWDTQHNNTSANIRPDTESDLTLAQHTRAAGVSYHEVYDRITRRKQPLAHAIKHARHAATARS
jgi:hypothetical protein